MLRKFYKLLIRPRSPVYLPWFKFNSNDTIDQFYRKLYSFNYHGRRYKLFFMVSWPACVLLYSIYRLFARGQELKIRIGLSYCRQFTTFLNLMMFYNISSDHIYTYQLWNTDIQHAKRLLPNSDMDTLWLMAYQNNHDAKTDLILE